MARLVTLVDVKANLNITSSGNDDELTGFLLDAISAVEDIVGPLSPVSFTETIDTHGDRIVLSRTPVVSVSAVSIQPWLGAAAIDDTAAWVVNTDSGILRRSLVGGAMPYYGRGSVFTVTYTAGRADVPGPVNRAILMQIADMWQSQRGAMPLPASGEAGPAPFAGSMGFLSPGVMELLLPHLPPPGIA